MTVSSAAFLSADHLWVFTLMFFSHISCKNQNVGHDLNMLDEEGQRIKMQCSSSGHPGYKQQSALNLSTTIRFLFLKFLSADFFTFYCFVFFTFERYSGAAVSAPLV